MLRFALERMAEKVFYRTPTKTRFHRVPYRKYLFPGYLEKKIATSLPNFHCCNFQKKWIFSVSFTRFRNNLVFHLQMIFRKLYCTTVYQLLMKLMQRCERREMLRFSTRETIGGHLPFQAVEAKTKIFSVLSQMNMFQCSTSNLPGCFVVCN